MHMESNTSKAIKGMSSQTIVTLVLGVIEIVSFSIMSRLLTQEDFGYYAAIAAITTVFASFSETGIGSAIIQKKEITGRFIDNSFTLSFIFGSILTLLLILLSYPLSILFADSNIMIPLMLMSITLLCNSLTSVNTSIMYRRLEFLQVGIINLVSLIITSLLAIVCAFKGYGFYAILVKAVLTSVLSLFLSFFAAKTRFHFSLDKETVRSIIGFSGWLMASVFFRNLAQQLDRLLLTRLLSVNALGSYNRPKEFINQITSKFGNIFDTVLFPVLSQMQDDVQSTRNAYTRSLYYLNIASIVIALGFIINGDLIIRLFFGNQWFEILPVMQILSISILFNFEARLADCYLRSLALTKQQFYFRILDVVLKIIGLFIGYSWGIIGVAVSVLITEFFMVIIKHVYISKKIRISLRDVILSYLSSMQLMLTSFPLLLLIRIIMPKSLTGDIMLLSIFCVIVIYMFVLCPSLVGSKYRDEIYPKVQSLLKFKQ